MGAPAHGSQGDALSVGAAALARGGATRRLPTLSLNELVMRASGGDRDAFEELVRCTYEDVFALAYRLTGTEEDACDVLQDAYLRAYRSIGAFRGDAALSTWLYRITANCASTHVSRRGRSRHDRLDDMPPLADAHARSDPEAMAGMAMERSRVAAALATLPPRLRAVVVLRDIYDLPHDTIATELGITEATAKVRLHRARKKLRERLFVAPETSAVAHAV